MKLRKGKKGKNYPEMVDSIDGVPKDEELTQQAEGSAEKSSGAERPERMEPVRREGGVYAPGAEMDAGEWPEEDSYHAREERRRPEVRGSAPADETDESQAPDAAEQEPDADPQREDFSGRRQDEGNGQSTEMDGEGGWSDGSTDEPQGTEQENQLSERDLARLARRKRRKRELRLVHSLIFVFVLLLLAAGGFIGYRVLENQGIDVLGSLGLGKSGEGELKGEDTPAAMTGQGEADAGAQIGAGAGETATEPVQTEPVTQAPVQVSAEVVAQADLMAAQYDYDGAIGLLQAQPEYASDASAQAKLAGYEAAKAACVEVSPDTVAHVFVHSLIVDPARAFDGDGGQDGYNLNMVTLEEFKKIIQSMYDNGYVLVSLHDMGEIGADGTMQRKSIWLPEGKKPIVFSQDDVSYYHSYENDGFADRLIVDADGKVKNEYTDAAGNTTVGDYDMVPVLDTFIEEHPDFSYHGRKGIVVLTGYNGVFGYRTDGDYRDKLSLQEDQAKWLQAHPEYSFEADVAAATEVANAMKANGWEFASHTWGHIPVADASLERLQTDTEKWLEYVSPIVGGTDMIIFAFGSDIGDWTGYADDNEKFNYLKSKGFDYFCNVDGSALSWVQFGNTYLRTGRMNIDGYRMATNPEILSPLFQVEAVYDYANRPEMSAWGQ